MDELKLREIEERAKKADAAIIAVAEDPRNFRMTIPAQPDDTDRLVCALAHEDVPALTAEVRRLRAELETERGRCVQACVNEYRRWRDVDPDSYGLALGAIGAASNILCAIERIPSFAAEPVHDNEWPDTAEAANASEVVTGASAPTP